MKLKDAIEDWPLTGWARGAFAWDNDPNILKLAAVTEPGTAGTFELTASDAQLCRWKATLVVDDSKLHAPVATALAAAVGRTLSEAGEIEL
jgi:hypothetical protein